MDPVTQGLLGAAAAQGVAAGRIGRRAAAVGLVAGMAADLDVLMQPFADPAFPVEFHRHFTHALAFVPVGAALVALPFAWCARRAGRGDEARILFLAALAAWLTHPLIDAFTSYGTLLFWPFSDARIALDWISIVDPLFTLMLAAGVGLTLLRGNARFAAIAITLSVGYLAFGGLQHARAVAAQADLAASRGHDAVRGRVIPTLGNLVLWRSVYESGDALHADGIRAGLARGLEVIEGERRPVATIEQLPPSARADERARGVFSAFSRFADGYTTVVSATPFVVGDARYSLVTGGFEPLWGVRFDDDRGDADLAWENLVRDRSALFGRFLDELLRVTPPAGGRTR